jgi:hypothetical protein
MSGHVAFREVQFLPRPIDSASTVRVATPVIEGLREPIQDEIGVQGARHPPAGDAPRERLDDKRDVDEPAPRCDVGGIRDPELLGGAPSSCDPRGRAADRPPVAGGSSRPGAPADAPAKPIARIKRRTRQRAPRAFRRMSFARLAQSSRVRVA